MSRGEQGGGPADKQAAKWAHAAITLMDESEGSGKPVVVLDLAKEGGVYRCTIAWTGRSQDIDDVLSLMKRKYPNAGIRDTVEAEEDDDDPDNLFAWTQRGEA